MRHLGARAAGRLLGLALVAGLIGPPALAGTEEQGLEVGPWEASGEAGGHATAQRSGIRVIWSGEIFADFSFSISGTGAARGTWTHGGETRQVVSGKVRGVTVYSEGNLEFRGRGRVGGDDRQLRLTGSTRQTGTITANRTVSLDATQSYRLPVLRMAVRSAACNEAVGDWSFTVQQQFQRRGFRASFNGPWIAFRPTEATEEDIAAILEAIFAGEPIPETRSPLLNAAGELIAEYNDFVDAFPDWTPGQVSEMFTRTEEILNLVRNLTDCDLELFGPDNVDQFFNGLTHVLQNLIIGAAGLELSGATWQDLVHGALRTGAIGPGAPNPERAVTAEQALIDAAEAILERNVDPADGLVNVTDETQAVMATAAAAGFVLYVNGVEYDARATYEETFGEPAPGAEPEA
jgi:hypothetical protein